MIAPIAVPAGLAGALAILAFLLAILGLLLAPAFARSRRWTASAAALALVPFAILMTAAVLAATSAALGTITGQHVGVREVATGALAVICITPILGAGFVRLRYGPTGKRTFYQQIAGNRVSSIMLVAILFEILAVTGFLIGAAVGILFGQSVATGLLFAAISVLVTSGATLFALRRGDSFILDIAKASKADTSGREGQLRNVVAEMATAAHLPVPEVYLVDTPALNAFAVGRDSAHGSIAVTRGLLTELDREELQGVVAHEMSHIANLDSRHGLLVALMVGAVVLLTDVFFASVVEMVQHPSFDGVDGLGGLLAAIALWVLVSILALAFAGALKLFAPLAARAVQAAVSRDREYLADATSVALTRNPSGLVSALAKLEAGGDRMLDANRGTQHLWIVNPVREPNEGGRGWFDTHPPTADRIARLRQLAGEEPELEDPRPQPGTSPA
jgi:heat shock protein HtpX